MLAIFHFSFEILHSACSVNLRATVAGGEWVLVASAVFKTVVSTRKRRKVGSIPTRLRHLGGWLVAGGGWGPPAGHPPSPGGRAHPLPAARPPLRFGGVREESDLHRAPFVRGVHRLHRPIERHLILGIDDDNLVCQRATAP